MLSVFVFTIAVIYASPIDWKDTDNTLSQDSNDISSRINFSNNFTGKPDNFSSHFTLEDFGIAEDKPFFNEATSNLDLPEIPPILDDVASTEEVLSRNYTTDLNITNLIERIDQLIANQTKPPVNKKDKKFFVPKISTTTEKQLKINLKDPNFIELIERVNKFLANQTMIGKQEVEEDSGSVEDIMTTTTTTENPANTNQDNDSLEEDEESGESEEEPGNFVQSLIKSFLGQLSTPEGGVDVDAVVGLIGGLSVANEDGTYDFSGLTETLQSFLGGDEEGGGGGSDVGAFLGGLVSAFIQGVAKPPGAKGAGILSGNLVAQILPGLSAPAPPPEGSGQPPQQGLDIGGFLQGFVKTFLGASSGGGNTNTTGNGNKQEHGGPHPFALIKQTLFKSLFSGVSSLFVKPSGASSGVGWK